MSKSAVGYGRYQRWSGLSGFIQTSEFNPDDATLSLIERNLNVKCPSSPDNDLANVLSCNIKSAVKTPDNYITE
jgi:hypothetical protein